MKKVALPTTFGLLFVVTQALISVNPKTSEGKLIMKLAVRIFALSVVVAGAAAASLSSSTSHAVTSGQAASASLPIPACGPNMPTCPPTR